MEEILRLRPQVIIFHTLFLGMRWTPAYFDTIREHCAALKDFPCLKIAIPQDEFIYTAPLNDFIREFGVSHVLTCADERDWHTIYNGIDREKTTLRTVLTGYIDDATVKHIRNRRKSLNDRKIDIGYRAWKAEYWLGEHGMQKTWIAALFQEKGEKAGLVTDISMEEKDVLHGNDWFDFLLACRATIGVEGGGSVLDPDGVIRQKTNEYLDQNPGASFLQVREACFPGEDGRIHLACLSPRHFEASITGTCQVLVEGRYNGIFEPWKHYIPLKKDHSNMDEIIEYLKDHEKTAALVEQAYHDIVQSGKWSYKSFIQEIERQIIDKAPEQERREGLAHELLIAHFAAREFLNWLFIRLEIWQYRAMNSTNPFWRIIWSVLKRFKRQIYAIFRVNSR
jgi:hypothetical protein